MKFVDYAIFGTLFILAWTSPSLAISIDEFDGEIAPTTSAVAFGGAMLGGEREVQGNLNATIEFSGGLGTFNSLTNIAARQFFWDGSGDSPNQVDFGLGGFDLTADGADRFLLAVTSVVSNPSVSFSIFDSSLGDTLRTGPIALSVGIVEIPFSAFTVASGLGASFADIYALQMTFSDNVASGGPGSVTFDYLRTNGTTAEVPEPASMALVGLGLSALGLRRRMVS